LKVVEQSKKELHLTAEGASLDEYIRVTTGITGNAYCF
jgi:hypothetical protein